MKKNITIWIFPLVLIAFALMLTFGCRKETVTVNPNTESEIEFNISFSKMATDKKAAHTLDDAKYIVLTIKTSANAATQYTSEKIELYKMGSEYFSQKLSLKVGSYLLTEFFLLDATDAVIYATPLAGSLQAQHITNPLPIGFVITKNKITAVSVEVLSTEQLIPEDFGLAGFPFQEVQTFSFLVNVSIKGQMDSIVVSELSVSSGTYTYNQSLEAIATNVVTLKDGSVDYTLTISKTGFESFVETYTLDSLKQHETVPITIELGASLATTVTDADGNVYNTVTIGTQVWMVENLKTTKYNDGTDIPLITDNAAWTGLSTPGYCWYGNNIVNKDIYGGLYNWYTVNTGKLCPTGWHMPTDEEWKILEMYLGMTQAQADVTTNWRGTDQGTQLKSTSGWNSGGNGTNTSGFSALPGGYRWYDGSFNNVGENSSLWSSAVFDTNDALGRNLYYGINGVLRSNFYKRDGFSVRCLKN
jgi:uncharacterized protein (TIGR02145 family)